MSKYTPAGGSEVPPPDCTRGAVATAAPVVAQPAPVRPAPKSAMASVSGLVTNLLRESYDMVKDTTRDAVTAPAAWVGMDKQSRLLREQEAKEREQKRVAAARAAQVPVAQAVAAPHLPGPPLPAGWGFAYDPQGRVYFLNHKERSTTYEDPRGKF